MLIRQRCSALIVHSKALSDDELSDFMQHIPGMVLINRISAGVCPSLRRARQRQRRADGHAYAPQSWSPAHRLSFFKPRH
ncbi:hypothetical protein LNQ52_19190 [Klebsiella pneumoniae subsp. pneumoniae]|nr:hypothetical protein [Klebsiella pneumoniae subsp. pneumoniae]